MKQSRHSFQQVFKRAQQGVVLMVTLVSLIILLLTATALFRSVDTSTLIAGNLALRQAAVAAGDKAIADAVTVLANLQAAGAATNQWQVLAHPLNNTNAGLAYYSFANPAVNLMADATWADGVSSALSNADRGANRSRYIIQRMCRTENQLPTSEDCLLNFIDKDDDSKKTGSGTVARDKNSVVYRITARVTGPRNTVSYVQAFVN